MTLGLILGIYAIPVITLLAWLWWELRKPLSDLDRRLDRLDQELDAQDDPGSLQARVDALRALGADADRLFRDEPAHGIRHTTRGWLSS